jgi:5'-nucleotidase (lipoprotein e(P4) family)
LIVTGKKLKAMRKYIFAPITLLILILLTCSCREKKITTFTGDQDHLIMSVLWFQKSAEARALFLQGYNVASARLKELSALPENGRPRAVVADLDETVLDNSPFEVWQISTGKGFTDENWKMWTDRAEALPLPGALGFFRLAESLGVEVFYVSNRSVDDAFDTTLQNLRKYGFPFADSAHLMLKSNTSSKVQRRSEIMATHDIILLLGDNLSDLDGLFESRGADHGFGPVDSLGSLFGNRLIVFPNPMYGSWVSPAQSEGEGLSLREKLTRGMTGF